MTQYRIDYIALSSKWAVRVDGSTAYISEHDTKQAAIAAMKRYELGDKRRRRQELDVGFSLQLLFNDLFWQRQDNAGR